VSIDSVEDEAAALSSAWRLQRTGNFVAAFDLAQDALLRWPDSQALEHVSILALASCGSTEAALDAFRATSLSANANEDFLALEARLLKDLAFSGRANAEAMLAQAAQAYERVAQRTDGTYSRQNAALLWLLAGDAERAVSLATQVAEQVTESNVPAEEQAAYFHWATLAEAALVRGDRAVLERAVAAGARDGVLHSEQGWPEQARAMSPDNGFDLILDPVGRWSESVRALRPGGRLVVLGANAAQTAEIDIRSFYFGQFDLLGTTMGSGKDFAGLLKMFDQYSVRAPVIDREFPMDRAAEAHEYLERGRAFGKCVLRND